MGETCSVEGCEELVGGAGLCMVHFRSGAAPAAAVESAVVADVDEDLDTGDGHDDGSFSYDFEN